MEISQLATNDDRKTSALDANRTFRTSTSRHPNLHLYGLDVAAIRRKDHCVTAHHSWQGVARYARTVLIGEHDSSSKTPYEVENIYSYTLIRFLTFLRAHDISFNLDGKTFD